jgi:hypothetical protein
MMPNSKHAPCVLANLFLPGLSTTVDNSIPVQNGRSSEAVGLECVSFLFGLAQRIGVQLKAPAAVEPAIAKQHHIPAPFAEGE